MSDICGVVDQFFLVHCPANTTWIIFFLPKNRGWTNLDQFWTSFGPVAVGDVFRGISTKSPCWTNGPVFFY